MLIENFSVVCLTNQYAYEKKDLAKTGEDENVQTQVIGLDRRLRSLCL